MITAVRANRASFKAIEIAPGFNLLLAEQTDRGASGEPERKRSTNGSGKTLLLLICHFCLGSRSVAAEICVPELAGWEFTVDVEIDGGTYEATRSVEDPANVRVVGDLSDWGPLAREVIEPETSLLDAETWARALGTRLYRLDPKEVSKSRPTFGGLFRYAIRHDEGAFGDLFRSFGYQKTIDRDVANAVFLGMDWHTFRDARRLLTRKKEVKKARGVRREIDAGENSDAPEVGQLEEELATVDAGLARQSHRLEGFRVHPDYREIEEWVSALSGEIRERSARSVSLRESLSGYRRAIEEDGWAVSEEVRRVYAEASLEFPSHVTRRLEEAEDFGRRLVRNRREYLGQEVERLEEEIAGLDAEVERLDRERAVAVRSIDGAGPASDLGRIQRRQEQLSERRGALRERIDRLGDYERELAELDAELSRNALLSAQSFAQAGGTYPRVTQLFAEFTARLFESPGRLELGVGRDGTLGLRGRAPRKKSQGVAELLVFSYDLALAVAGVERGFGPRLLFHDSRIFDGVDQRQKAAAIELAIEQSEAHDFRYLLCINEGDVPWEYLDSEELRGYLRRRLTDQGDGGLLGIRFEPRD
jgi:uncharacterized protein YydD (DUF2326 family)